MLCRVNLILPRGSALSSPDLLNRTYRKFSFSTSQQSSRYTKAYLFCAVGGIVVAASVREDVEDMAPLDLPGRPGNLTDDQKVKLKEMWLTAFKVFGIPTEDRIAPELENNADSSNGLSPTGTDTSDVQQNKGGKITSLFKKKKNKESTAAPSTTETPNDVSKLLMTDGDDKYSQTKEFKEALATSTPQEIHDTFWRMVKADHPDSLFLRFLRARKWDVNKAIVMLVATMHWRSKELDVTFLMFDFGLMVG